uniref:Uncharacterized protein n=1 Tax=Parascaris univalens TaxID=6257 RepID=A0A914ZQX5_PARUN
MDANEKRKSRRIKLKCQHKKRDATAKATWSQVQQRKLKATLRRATGEASVQKLSGSSFVWSFGERHNQNNCARNVSCYHCKGNGYQTALPETWHRSQYAKEKTLAETPKFERFEPWRLLRLRAVFATVEFRGDVLYTKTLMVPVLVGVLDTLLHKRTTDSSSGGSTKASPSSMGTAAAADHGRVMKITGALRQALENYNRVQNVPRISQSMEAFACVEILFEANPCE